MNRDFYHMRFSHAAMRMAPDRPAHRAIEWTPADSRRKRGRPKKTWRSTFREDLQARGVSWSEKETMAADRVRWRNLLLIVPQGTGASKCYVSVLKQVLYCVHVSVCVSAHNCKITDQQQALLTAERTARPSCLIGLYSYTLAKGTV